MAFTYNDSDLSGDTVSAVRFVVGDTVKATALLSDGEISHLLTTYTSARAACVPAVDAMIAKCAARPTQAGSGQEQVTYAQRSQQLATLRDSLVALGYPDHSPEGSTPGATVTRLSRRQYGEVSW